MSMFSINIMRLYYPQIDKRMYLQELNPNQQNAEFFVIKFLFHLLLKKLNDFEWQVSLLFFSKL